VTNGHHVWTDRNIDAMFELQDEMALKVDTEIQGEILEGEMARLNGLEANYIASLIQQVQAIDTMHFNTKGSYFAAQRYVETLI